ncbi:MAG TPA: hypothetical protein PL033_00130 [Candidatus Brocadiia bacterium]|nr:hypothetical protein [Candidatus Brocadiia bacterium]
MLKRQTFHVDNLEPRVLLSSVVQSLEEIAVYPVRDDHGNTAEDATIVPVSLTGELGGRGTLEVAGDVDFFAFAAAVEGKAQLNVNAYPVDGPAVLDGDDIIVPEGTHFAVIDDAGKTIAETWLPYVIRKPDPTDAKLVIGPIVPGPIEPIDPILPYDLLLFGVEAGRTYYVAADGGPWMGYDFSGKIPAPEPPDDYGDTFGDAFKVEVPIAGDGMPRPIVNGVIEVAGDVDMFVFASPAEGIAHLELGPDEITMPPFPVNTMIPRVVIFDSEGNVITEAASDSPVPTFVDFSVTKGATYYIASQSQTGSSGMYYVMGEIEVTDDHGDTIGNATQIEPGAWGLFYQPGMLEEFGDVDVFAVTAGQDGAAVVFGRVNTIYRTEPANLDLGPIEPPVFIPRPAHIWITDGAGNKLTETWVSYGGGVIDIPIEPRESEPLPEPVPMIPSGFMAFPALGGETYYIWIDTGPGLQYRLGGQIPGAAPEDDHGDSATEATILDGNPDDPAQLGGLGLIELGDDVDAFTFTAGDSGRGYLWASAELWMGPPAAELTGMINEFVADGVPIEDMAALVGVGETGLEPLSAQILDSAGNVVAGTSVPVSNPFFPTYWWLADAKMPIMPPGPGYIGLNMIEGETYTVLVSGGAGTLFTLNGQEAIDDHGDTTEDATTVDFDMWGEYWAYGSLGTADDVDVFAITPAMDGMAVLNGNANEMYWPYYLNALEEGGDKLPYPAIQATVVNKAGEFVADLIIPVGPGPVYLDGATGGDIVIDPMPIPWPEPTEPVSFKVSGGETYFIIVNNPMLKDGYTGSVSYGLYGEVPTSWRDDHGDTFEDATLMVLDEELKFDFNGLLGKPGDLDVFTFSAEEWGTMNFSGWAAYIDGYAPDILPGEYPLMASAVAYNSVGEVVGSMDFYAYYLPIEPGDPLVVIEDGAVKSDAVIGMPVVWPPEPFMSFDVNPGEQYYVVVSGESFVQVGITGRESLPPPDDYGDTMEEAQPIEVVIDDGGIWHYIIGGNIERPLDGDFFVFDAATSGSASITLNVDYPMYPMVVGGYYPTNDLQPHVVIFDAHGNTIAEAAQPSGSASVTFDVRNGKTYYVAAFGDSASHGRYYLTGEVKYDPFADEHGDSADDATPLDSVEWGLFYDDGNLQKDGDKDFFSVIALEDGRAMIMGRAEPLLIPIPIEPVGGDDLSRIPRSIMMTVIDGDGNVVTSTNVPVTWDIIIDPIPLKESEPPALGFLEFQAQAGETYYVVMSGGGGVHYRLAGVVPGTAPADDHANSLDGATVLDSDEFNSSILSGNGLVGTVDDVDYFTFVADESGYAYVRASASPWNGTYSTEIDQMLSEFARSVPPELIISFLTGGAGVEPLVMTALDSGGNVLGEREMPVQLPDWTYSWYGYRERPWPWGLNFLVQEGETYYVAVSGNIGTMYTIYGNEPYDDHGDTTDEATSVPHDMWGDFTTYGGLEWGGDVDVFAVVADRTGEAKLGGSAYFLPVPLYAGAGDAAIVEGEIEYQVVTVQVVDDAGTLVGSLELPVSWGPIIYEDGGDVLQGAAITFAAEEGRTYFLLVSQPEETASSNIGFDLSGAVPTAYTDDHGDTFDAATALEFSDELSLLAGGFLGKAEDVDVFSFTSDEWGVIRFTAHGAYMDVIRPEGEGGGSILPPLSKMGTVKFYDSDGDLVAQMSLSSPYIIYEGGKGDLGPVIGPPIIIEPPIIIDPPIIIPIDPTISFDVNPGETYYIVVEGDILVRYDVSGQLRLAPPDDYGDTMDVAHPVDVVVAESGWHYIEGGNIGHPGDTDMFSFVAGKDGTANIDLNVEYPMILPVIPAPYVEPNNLQPRILIFDSTGAKVAEAWADGGTAGVSFAVEEGKTYYIAARGDESSHGMYSLTGEISPVPSIEDHLVRTLNINGVKVHIYDMDDGPSDIDLAFGPDGAYLPYRSEIIVLPGLPGRAVSAIVFTGDFAGAGIAVEGSVGAVIDARRPESGDVAFLIAKGDVGAVALRSPLSGEVLDGLRLVRGWTVPNDVDGDGRADALGMLVGGHLGALVVTGKGADGVSIAGDVVVGGKAGLVYALGDINGDVVSELRLDAVKSLGGIAGRIVSRLGDVISVWALEDIVGDISAQNVELVYSAADIIGDVVAGSRINSVIAGKSLRGLVHARHGINLAAALTGDFTGGIETEVHASRINVVRVGGGFRGTLQTPGYVGSIIAGEIAPAGAGRVRIVAESGIDAIAVRQDVRDADIGVGMDGALNGGPAVLRSVLIGRDCIRTNLLAGARTNEGSGFPNGGMTLNWSSTEPGRIDIVRVGRHMGDGSGGRWAVGASGGYGYIADSQGRITGGYRNNVAFWEGS